MALYGAGNGYWTRSAGASKLYAFRYATKEEPSVVDLDQGVDRIEAMGDDAVVVGSRQAGPGLLTCGAWQGGARAPRLREGFVGLPIRKEGARGSRYLTEGSASVLFLNNRGLELSLSFAPRGGPAAREDDDSPF